MCSIFAANSATDCSLAIEESKLLYSLIDKIKKECLQQSLLQAYSVIVYACLCLSALYYAGEMDLDASILLRT